MVQLGLKITHEWYNEVGRNLNPAKTVVVPFTESYKLKRMGPIFLLGNTILLTKEIKYMGVTFDIRMNFATHV